MLLWYAASLNRNNGWKNLQLNTLRWGRLCLYSGFCLEHENGLLPSRRERQMKMTILLWFSNCNTYDVRIWTADLGSTSVICACLGDLNSGERWRQLCDSASLLCCNCEVRRQKAGWPVRAEWPYSRIEGWKGYNHELWSSHLPVWWMMWGTNNESAKAAGSGCACRGAEPRPRQWQRVHVDRGG